MNNKTQILLVIAIILTLWIIFNISHKLQKTIFKDPINFRLKINPKQN